MEIEELIKLEEYDKIATLIEGGSIGEKEKIKKALEKELESPSFGHKHEGIIPSIVADIYSTRKEAKRRMLMYKALSARLSQAEV